MADEGERDNSNFLVKLHTLLHGATMEKDGIMWNADGNGLVMSCEQMKRNNICSSFFRHNNPESFRRQLNYYGFHKTKEFSDSHRSIHRYFHPDQNFIKGDVDRCRFIKKQRRSSKKQEKIDIFLSQSNLTADARKKLNLLTRNVTEYRPRHRKTKQTGIAALQQKRLDQFDVGDASLSFCINSAMDSLASALQGKPPPPILHTPAPTRVESKACEMRHQVWQRLLAPPLLDSSVSSVCHARPHHRHHRPPQARIPQYRRYHKSTSPILREPVDTDNRGHPHTPPQIASPFSSTVTPTAVAAKAFSGDASDAVQPAKPVATKPAPSSSKPEAPLAPTNGAPFHAVVKKTSKVRIRMGSIVTGGLIAEYDSNIADPNIAFQTTSYKRKFSYESSQAPKRARQDVDGNSHGHGGGGGGGGMEPDHDHVVIVKRPAKTLHETIKQIEDEAQSSSDRLGDGAGTGVAHAGRGGDGDACGSGSFGSLHFGSVCVAERSEGGKGVGTRSTRRKPRPKKIFEAPDFRLETACGKPTLAAMREAYK